MLQASLGRSGKQQQDPNSPNHVQVLFPGPVFGCQNFDYTKIPPDNVTINLSDKSVEPLLYQMAIPLHINSDIFLCYTNPRSTTFLHSDLRSCFPKRVIGIVRVRVVDRRRKLHGGWGRRLTIWSNYVQGSTNRRAPGCVNAGGKLRQKW